jgi:hypothetical protein
MSIPALLNQTVALWRLAPVSGTSKKAASQISVISIMIQPMSAYAAQSSQLTFARAYTGFVLQTAGVEIGDWLVDASGDKYDVQGIRSYSYGTQPFVELTLQKRALQGQSS